MATKIYTGIGSRETPEPILRKMTEIAQILGNAGWTLRSGGASGADTAFEQGATLKEIYLPWKGYSGNTSPLYKISKEATKLAEQFHPAWNRCGKAAKLFHSRNVYQVLGYDLKTPTQFIICWHNGTGGTLQACRIAEAYKIPIFNMSEVDWKARLILFVKKALNEYLVPL